MRRYLILVNLAAFLVLAGAIAFQSVADRNEVQKTSFEHAANLADALGEHTRQTIEAIDLNLSNIEDAIRPLGVLEQADPEALRSILLERQQRAAATRVAFALDATGRFVTAPSSLEGIWANPYDLVEFERHVADDSAGLIVGPPRRLTGGSARNRWVVNLTRRLDRPDGSFGGVIGVALSVEYLLDFYDALRLGERGAVGLFTPDGILIARSPFEDDFIGRDLSSGRLFSEYLRKSDRGQFAARYVTDDTVRLTAYRRAADGRAVVYVGIAESDILTGWRQRLIFRCILGAVIMSLILGASLLLLRQATRQQIWNERRSQRLKLLADATTDAVKAPDPDTVLEHLAEAGRRLTNARHAETRLAPAAGSLDPRGLADAPSQARETEVPATEDGDFDGRSVLTVPIAGQDGNRVGTLRLLDKEGGSFTRDDENEMIQLASTAGVAIETMHANAAREAALKDAESSRRDVETILSSISDGMYVLDTDWRFIYLNGEAERVIGRKRDDLIGKNIWTEFPALEESAAHEHFMQALGEGHPVSFEFREPTMSKWFSVRAFPHEGGLTVYFQDVTQRVEMNERLRQSQKMDAIGQLTGGVAHDFNNLLTVILGHADDLVEYLSDAPAHVREEAVGIQSAGERAAELTHRLLAFARRQPLHPRSTDIGSLIAGLENLMRRTLGENINIKLHAEPDLWKGVVDPGELENALLNIAINARDAMPLGGSLTVESSNAVVEGSYAAQNEVAPGDYVLVAVSDTGEGIPPETLEKVFDPFFTTKPLGKGSGLGLSMVYGFARQTGGQVKIYSEVGQGTTVRLYIPRSTTEAVPHPARVQASPPSGTEHVLVVEDDDQVRRHVVGSLRSLGYRVEERANGPDAIALLDSGATFDLLVTDVVLPDGMSGKDVANATLRRLPGVKVLYMSGYTENAIIHHGRLDEGVNLLSKPFRLAELAHKVREALDR